MSTASNSSLKQSCSALTSVTSALEVIFNVMRSINPRFTYLLTYTNVGLVKYGGPLKLSFITARTVADTLLSKSSKKVGQNSQRDHRTVTFNELYFSGPKRILTFHQNQAQISTL